MKISYRFIVLIFISFLYFQSANGQLEIDKYSVNPKLGLYFSSSNVGFATGVETNIAVKRLLYSVDYYRFQEVQIVFPNSPSEYCNQIGFMIGKYFGEKNFRIQWQGGIAPIWGLKRTDILEHGSGWFSGNIYKSERFFTAGLVLKIGLKINPTSFLGIGIDFQANINSQKTIYMPMISIELGKIRKKTNTRPWL
jgi:hypothetical protein